MSCKQRTFNRFVSLLGVSVGGLASFFGTCVYRGDENFYANYLMPVISGYFDPEMSHAVCIFMTKHGLIRCRDNLSLDKRNKLKTTVFNLTFTNPIGLAAGFDKNAQAVPGLHHYGLGFAEVGTITPRAQDGNPKKRIFRIPEDRALINRCGFNNYGLSKAAANLSNYANQQPFILGLNIGKNKNTSDISRDYLIGLEEANNLSCIDYIVINISSPNTPGLRDSQSKKNLEILLSDLLKKMDSLSIQKPLLLKIAPDLRDDEIKDIAEVITAKKCGAAKVSGIILTNTTVSRPLNDKVNPAYSEAGGLSGQPLRDISTEIIGKFYKITNGMIPIIGVGGVCSGKDAYEKIKAGASLIQLYTSITYEGPPIVNRVKRELVELLEKDHLNSVSEAVGLNYKPRHQTDQNQR